MAVIVEENTQTVEPTTEKTSEQARAEKQALALSVSENLGTDIENLEFLGCLANNKSIKPARVGGKDIPLPSVIGYAFRWNGNEPLEYAYDKLLSANPKNSLLAKGLTDQVEIRTANKGDVFYLTLFAAGALLGQERFNSQATITEKILKKYKLTEGHVQLVVKGWEKAKQQQDPSVATPHLKHLDRSKVGSGEKRTVIALKVENLPVYDKVDKDGKAADGAQLKPEFADQFKAIATRNAGGRAKGEKAPKINSEGLEFARLFNKVK